MRRKVAFVLLCLVLVVGAVENLTTISYPQRKMTTYFRTHPRSMEQIPDYETDVSATVMNLFGLNVAIVFVSGAICLAGGFLFAPHNLSVAHVTQNIRKQNQENNSSNSRKPNKIISKIILTLFLTFGLCFMVDDFTGQINPYESGITTIGYVLGSSLLVLVIASIPTLLFKREGRFYIRIFFIITASAFMACASESEKEQSILPQKLDVYRTVDPIKIDQFNGGVAQVEERLDGMYIYLGGEYPNQKMIAYIPKEYESKFQQMPTASDTLEVNGGIVKDNGMDEIIVTDPFQIQIKETPFDPDAFLAHHPLPSNSGQ